MRQAQNQRRPAGEARPAAKPPDEPRTSGWCEQALFLTASRAQVQQERAKNQWFSVTSARKDEPVNSGETQGASARRRSQTLGVCMVQASAKEFEDGRVRQAELTRKLPSPALKEAERSRSYNPSALNTLMRGTVRHGTVQGHIAGRATRTALCESTQT